MKKLFGLSVLAIVAYAAAPPALAGEYTGPGFSADLTIRDHRLGSGRYHGRYYFDRGGYRMEIDGRSRVKAFIFNSFDSYFVSVGANKRVDIDEDKSGALSMLFSDTPCAGFHNAFQAGSDGRGGRELKIWRCDKPKQELLDAGYSWEHKATVWYDEGLKHFVRMESNDGVKIELSNVVPGRQAPSLFDVPTEGGPVQASTRIADVETVD